MAKMLQVSPLIDIQNAEFAKQYELGVFWAMYGDEQGKGPVSASYLVTNLKSYVECGCFNADNDGWLQHIGFFLGMYHGGILEPSTGQLHPDVTTLANLNHRDAVRGYDAGREWYFVETEPHERRWTESQIITRLKEDATEMTEYKNEEGTWFFCVGCLLGELSGQLFPMNAQERQEWEPLQQEIEQARKKYRANQECSTEPLQQSAILQEA